MKLNRQKWCAWYCLLALSGCALGPHTEFVTPKISMPRSWAHAAVSNATIAPAPWWRAFNDPLLTRLIEDALARNSDLALATLKVRQARLKAGLAQDAEQPVLSAGLNTSRSQYYSNGKGSSQSSTASVSLSYEADLWGKLARTHDAAEWEAQASEQDRESTALALSASVASLYWKIAYLNQRIKLSEQSVAYQQQSLALMQARHAAGDVSALDEISVEQSLASQRASHTAWLQEREEANSALAILFDGPPEQLFSQATRLPTGPMPEVAAGLPSSLLARRPDLRAAELRLRATQATVDQTRASYYPSLTLTGALGSSSSALRQVLQNPFTTLGADLVLPFLQWNEMQLNIKVSQNSYQQAVVSFRQSLYSALADVENALSARQQSAAQVSALAQAFDQAVRSEQLNAVRYRAGQVARQQWLDASETRRSAEALLAAARLDQLDNQATVYQALGG
jgi:NodT family efflux transporter outer membrane factor (OMF) lipoprotein